MSCPYITPTGYLVIPFDCERRYHWWSGGQSILRTLDELGAPPVVRNSHDPDIGRDSGALSIWQQAMALAASETELNL